MLLPAVDQGLEPQLSVADAQRMRAQLGDAIQDHQAIAVLDIGERRCRLMLSEGDHGHPQPVCHHMQLGLHLLAHRTFRQRMPNEAQLEQAIMLIEDAILPIARLIPPSNVFVSRDPCVREVARHALGVPHLHSIAQATGRLPVLSREAVEHQFERLARQAGHPHTPAGDLPQSPRWAATLLILREVLHHWQLGAVRLLEPSAPSSDAGGA